MKSLILSEPSVKSNGFKKFLLKRNPSEKFATKYITYMNSSLIRRKTKLIARVSNIYEVSSLPLLYKIYNEVKIESSNIRLHNIYSGVLSAYIKYLTGNKLRKIVVSRKDSNHKES